MGIKKIVKSSCFVLVVIGLTGCGTHGYNHQHASNITGAKATRIGSAKHFKPDQVGINGVRNTNITQDTFYFEFDSNVLTHEDETALEQHAKYLQKHPKSHIRIEGHTDERGSREYNIALGERRAKAINSFFKTHGVNKDQISVVSFGKEKPAAIGHDEVTYAKNRRAKIVYEETA